MPCAKAEAVDVDATPVPTILERIGAELGNLADRVDTLQDTLGPLLMEVAHDQPHAMVEIQGIDAIAQTLSGLSTFVASLAQSGLKPQAVDLGLLADRLTLTDLANRLRGQSDGDDEDDFELF